jgi:aminopeptidase N
VQKGLPRRLFIQVASHEYAHAWQGENCPLLKDTNFREGFAEWVAYIVLSVFKDKELMRKMLKGDNKYSKGLQKMLDLETKVGRKGVLEACKKHR